MPFHDSGGVRYFTFDSLDAYGLRHGGVGRRGGVSPAPWESLNLGGTVGDAPKRVAENRRRAFDALGLRLSSAFDVWQVHSADIVLAGEPRGAPADRPGRRDPHPPAGHHTLHAFRRLRACPALRSGPPGSWAGPRRLAGHRPENPIGRNPGDGAILRDETGGTARRNWPFDRARPLRGARRRGRPDPIVPRSFR